MSREETIRKIQIRSVQYHIDLYEKSLEKLRQKKFDLEKLVVVTNES